MDNNNQDEYLAENTEDLVLMGLGQKLAIYAIIFNFLIRAYAKNDPLSESVVFLSLFTAVLSVIGIWKMASGQKFSTPVKFILMVPCTLSILISISPIFTSLPMIILPALLTFIILVTLSIRSTRMLKNAGYAVGFFGAK